MTGRTCAIGSCEKAADHRLQIIPEGGSGSPKRARVAVCGSHVETIRQHADQMMEAVLNGLEESPAPRYRVEEVDQLTVELER